MSDDETHEWDHQSGEMSRLCLASLVLSFRELEAQHVECERVVCIVTLIRLHIESQTPVSLAQVTKTQVFVKR
jgi:hypothetical protein